MNKLYKPNAEEKRIIRRCAEKSAGFKRVEINPSTKRHLDDLSKPEHMNILFVTNEPKGWNDTDLADNCFSWGDFLRGVEMTEDGRAIIDFYVYDMGRYPELQTNVTIYVEGGRLVRVDGTCDGTMWKAGA